MSKESIEISVKDSYSISSSATFKPRKLVWNLSANVVISVFKYLSS